MLHPYDQLAPEYDTDWATAHVKPERQHEAFSAGDRLLRDLTIYQDAEKEFAVPALWLMCTNERESSGNLHTYLGNGDPLDRVTRDVPRGRGPFPTWQAGAKDALTLDGIVLVKVWNPSRAAFEWELWNGWGYRARGIRSPYLVGGTTLQQPGKYVADGVWSSSAWDTQLGCLAIAWAILQRRPELAFTGAADIVKVDAPPLVPAPSPPPMTVGGSHHDTRWLQAALNKVAADDSKMASFAAAAGGPEQIGVDGIYGRETRIFVRAIEQAQGLTVDRGFAGPQVYGALDKILGTTWQPAA